MNKLSILFSLIYLFFGKGAIKPEQTDVYETGRVICTGIANCNKTVPREGIYSTTTGSVAFSSDAPLELIKAQSSELHGKFDAGKREFAFLVKINSFDGFNSPLQREHFNENYMESSHYPVASFSGKIIEEIDFSRPGTYVVRGKGHFLIHGVLQERIIKSELVIKDNKISCRCSFSILLVDYNIPIPKVVHEKLASEIKVDIRAELAAE